MNKKIPLSVRFCVIAAVLVLLIATAPSFAQDSPKNLKNKQTDKPAIVFLIAGQSNAGGCGVFSPQLHEKLGRHENRPLVPGSTAKEIGLSTDAANYTHSYMWVPGKGFQRTNPDTNLRPSKPDVQMHGMELPVIAELEKRFPENDIYVVKYGPGATNLYHDWNPQRTDGRYAVWLGYYHKAMAQLIDEYTEVRVVGLYWDQGESDAEKANDYAKNLTNFIAVVRRDTGISKLKFFIRKHIFNGLNIDTIIAAQEKVVEDDPRCYLLDIDLGNRKANYEAWAWSPGNRHVSSKGFVELTKRLFDGELRDATVESFDLYDINIADRQLVWYTSSVSSWKEKPLKLNMELFYDKANSAAPVVLVMHGYSGRAEHMVAASRYFRDKGFFAAAVNMRGRGGSQGKNDSGGLEIYDIYDAAEYIKQTYADYCDETSISIVGFSGGGGNTMSAITRFPDYFRVGASFFGISDYGYSDKTSWYAQIEDKQAQHLIDKRFVPRIGGRPGESSDMIDRYHARVSAFGAKNNPYSEIHLFVNNDETICPKILHSQYLDNALAEQTFPGEFDNVRFHLGYKNTYKDFNGDGKLTEDEEQYWVHGYPNLGMFNSSMDWFIDRLKAGQIPQPKLNDHDNIFVGGYLRTEKFAVWLGDGQNAAADLDYDLRNGKMAFKLKILSLKKSITGSLTAAIDENFKDGGIVKLNGNKIDSCKAGDTFVYAHFADGDIITIEPGTVPR